MVSELRCERESSSRKEGKREGESTEEGKRDNNNTDRDREKKRDRRRTAEILIRNRSSSAGEIRGIISRKRGRNPPKQKGRKEKKIAMGNEKEEKINKENK